jgi:hypothetical protein
MLSILTFGMLDIIIAFCGVNSGAAFVSREISLVFLVVFIRTLRTTIGEIGRVFAAAGPILLLIAFFILWFSFIGFVLFTNIETTSIV